MGFYYGVVQQYDFFGDGTGGYLVNFSDGDAVHLSTDDVNACLLSRHDQLAYCERRLHPNPTTSWTGMAPQVPSAALSGTKRPDPTQQVTVDGMHQPEDGPQLKKQRLRGKRGKGVERSASRPLALTREGRQQQPNGSAAGESGRQQQPNGSAEGESGRQQQPNGSAAGEWGRQQQPNGSAAGEWGR